MSAGRSQSGDGCPPPEDVFDAFCEDGFCPLQSELLQTVWIDNCRMISVAMWLTMAPPCVHLTGERLSETEREQDGAAETEDPVHIWWVTLHHPRRGQERHHGGHQEMLQVRDWLGEAGTPVCPLVAGLGLVLSPLCWDFLCYILTHKYICSLFLDCKDLFWKHLMLRGWKGALPVILTQSH